ncbi:hypothetical protein GOP47_0006368 [Adiantum capillus-veneris]|uniref:Uncharacterized protein n=1 Tax=Adiantum capillus-veneris TaxID=13818 RepID=A0A9D4ZLZ0_ADICA|nr:hypothetical protein GOP47_0006368 [Adiantum capillus-veneris]
MAISKQFCLPAGDCRCSSHQKRLPATLSSSNSHSRICPFSRHRSLFRPHSLTVEREESGWSAAADRWKSPSPTTSSSEDNSSLVYDDDDASDDDDELGSVEDAIKDLVELDDLVSDGNEEDDDGSEALSSDTSDGKADIHKRVQELCLRIQRRKDDKITARDLSALYNFRIDKFQRLAIEGFLKGSSVVVCAPTSSGKTLIAECAAAATLALKRRLFYTTPLKALSNQKLREFRTMFGEENVGLITGDASVNRDAPILIMTTEILRNMLYQSLGTLEEGDQLHNVSMIVLDEVHYLSDTSRGTVWEEVVIYCPKEVQLICLSATVANSDELAGWIAKVHGPTELVTSRRRPVPLTWHFSSRYSLAPLLSNGGTQMNRRLALGGYNYEVTTLTDEEFSNEDLQFSRRRQVPRVEETLEQLKSRGMLPAIWFIFSRKGCDTAIRYVRDLQLLSDEEQRQVYEALTTFRGEHPDAVRESSVSALRCGFAAHHAGCLPLWKGFIEELFQRGLIKVVFSTETLAAGINMPARTTVLSSLSKRGDNGHNLLSSNSMLQMAGRAGRRGLDEQGHVVLVQTPFEGAEEGCKILFAGPDPLVSQFTASYGMVLHLLSSMKSADGKVLRQGRTLEEARALVERSFGNYVGNEVKAKVMKQISKFETRIAHLKEEEIPDVRSLLTAEEIEEYMKLKNDLKVEKDRLKELWSEFEQKKLDLVQPLLQDAVNDRDHLPYVQICYITDTGSEIKMSAMCFEILQNSSFFNQKALEDNQVSEDLNGQASNSHMDVQYSMALGFDNCWYAFSATSVQSIKKIKLRNVTMSSKEGSARDLLAAERPEPWESSWEMVGKSGKSAFTSVWCSMGFYNTSALSRNIPDDSHVTEEVQFPEEISLLANAYAKQRRKNTKLKKEIKGTKASKEYWQVVAMTKLRDANIEKLEKKRSKLVAQVNRMQPTGWQKFLQVVNVLEQAKAISPNTHDMLPLGKVAASIRGANELWLALALSDDSLPALNSAQLASVCGCLVTEGIKVRSYNMDACNIYTTSTTVQEVVYSLEKKRRWLLDLQNECGVTIACCLDDQLAGLVEAWASGVTWRELMAECDLDEGDLARLLRRTIDLLAQVLLLPNVNSELHKVAASAAKVMDRSPISELIA